MTEMSTEDTRTGATTAEIEASFARLVADHPHWSDEGVWGWRVHFDERVKYLAPLLIPPGSRIASPEIVAAMTGVVEWMYHVDTARITSASTKATWEWIADLRAGIDIDALRSWLNEGNS